MSQILYPKAFLFHSKAFAYFVGMEKPQNILIGGIYMNHNSVI